MNELSYEQIQVEESKTWLFTDLKGTPEEVKVAIDEKLSRERIRYYQMAKNMLLDKLDTPKMSVLDVGSSCTGGVSSVLPFKKRICADPLKADYSKIVDVSCFIDTKAEDLKEQLGDYEVILSTNAIDHFEDPIQFLKDLGKYMKYSAYFAHQHVINNATEHPHPAHKFNLNPQIFKEILDKDFELVWELKYPDLIYSWNKLPCFSQLYRKVTK